MGNGARIDNRGCIEMERKEIIADLHAARSLLSESPPRWMPKFRTQWRGLRPEWQFRPGVQRPVRGVLRDAGVLNFEYFRKNYNDIVVKIALDASLTLERYFSRHALTRVASDL